MRPTTTATAMLTANGASASKAVDILTPFRAVRASDIAFTGCYPWSSRPGAQATRALVVTATDAATVTVIRCIQREDQRHHA